MEAIIRTLKKMKKDEIIDVVAQSMELYGMNREIFEAILVEDPEDKFDAFHDLIPGLVGIDEMNSIDLSKAKHVIDIYSKQTVDLAGVVVLQLNLIVAAIRVMGLLNDNAYGVEEAKEELLEVFQDAIKSAQALEIYPEVSRVIFSLLAFAKMAEYSDYEELKQLVIHFMDINEEGFETILAEIMTNMLNAEYDDECWEDDDEELDAIFGEDDDEDWDDEEFDEDDEEEAPEIIRKATPKEKITKLF